MDVRFDGVRFKRGKRTILELPRLEFATGRVTALLGPNGSGKTTALRLIAGLEPVDLGRVTVGGTEVRRASDAAPHVAIAFQRAVMLRGSVRHNLDIALRFRGLDEAERRARIETVASACTFGNLLDREARSLSGGEGQRVNLGRALALEAPVTLLDEPLAGFDAEARREMMLRLPGLLRQFGSTVILVTHDRDEAVRLAEDVVVLREGRVVAMGEAATIFSQPPDAETAAYFGYTVLRCEDRTIAIAPGQLVLGEGEVRFSVTVERMVDLGGAIEGVGLLGDVSMTFRIDPTHAAPSPGEVVFVSVDKRSVVRF